jgi:murein DD-endopeptidase MepM/ murein hydrolase activator NlpD
MTEMRRSRALIVTALLVVGTALPAAAQESSGPPDSSSDTTTTTSPDTTTTTSSDTTPDTSVPPDSTPDTSVPPTTVPDLTTDPGINGDAPPESVPVDNNLTVPAAIVPPRALGGAVPPRAHVVQVDVQTAQASALVRNAAYAAAAFRRQELEAALMQIQQQLNGLDSRSRDAIRNLTDARGALVERAIYAYVRGGDEEERWAEAGDASGQRAVLLSAVADRDQAVVARYKDAQENATRDEAKTAQDLSATQAALDLARVDEAQALTDLNSAQLEVAVTTAGGNIVVHGFVFPVASPHTFHEDFGDPRFPGTPQAHSHQGCDVVAAEGTELYAAERGIVTQVSSSGLGGNGLWLKGESGTYYYYAHLSAFVLGLAAGQLVEAGQVVGYVGHTGDAYGPHLHFEVHPNGGSAVDPYPILLAADPQQRPPAQP